MDELYLHKLEGMSKSDDQVESGPSPQTDQSSGENNEGEKGTCASILESVAVGIGLLIPIFWPVSIPYLYYRWDKKYNQPYLTGRSTAEPNCRPGPTLVISLSGEKLQSLSAGAHRITVQFTPTTKYTDDFSVTKEYQFKVERTARALVSVVRDTATIKLYSNAEGEFKYSLDKAPFQKCVASEEELSRLSAGPHKIIVHFVVANSLEEITCLSDEYVVDQIAEVSVTTVEDGAAMKLDSNFPTDFQYSLNRAEFKSCSSKEKFSKLSARSYHLVVQFIPTESSPPSLEKIERSVEFKIAPKAWGSVTICKDKAVLELTANVNGVFEYSLDTEKHGQLNAESYQKCEGLQEIHQLSAGKHSLTIQFVYSHAEKHGTLELKPLIDFTTLSKDWYTSQCQPVRLQNLGNTCFFNSALQSTFKTDVFHKLCLYWPHVLKFCVSTDTKLTAFNDCHSPELILEPFMKSYEIPNKTGDDSLDISVSLEPGPLTKAWIHLFTNISTSLSIFPFLPSDMLEQLGKRNPRFVQRTQEDSHEALRCIFDAIKIEEIEVIIFQKYPVKCLINLMVELTCIKVNSPIKFVATKIQQVKKAIKERFGVTDAYTEGSLDGEEKLKLKGYLRMASKVPTVIGQVIQGKVVSVTICHECLDVTENEESYFDISLPMPDETLHKCDNGAAAYRWKPEEKGSIIKENSDENGNCITDQLTDNLNYNDEAELQRANSATEATLGATTNKTDICSSQASIEDLPTNVEPQSSNVRTLPTKTVDEVPATNVDEHHTSPSDTDDQHSTVQSDGKETKSSEGSDTGKANTPVVEVPEATATEHNSDNFANLKPASQASGMLESLALAQHLGQQNVTQKCGQKPQQNTEETALSPTKLSASQEANQENQEATKYELMGKEKSQDTEETTPDPGKLSVSQGDNQIVQEDTKDDHTDEKRHKKIISEKNYFQQYLIEKGLNHQLKEKTVGMTDLQFCLSMYTDLDVLDEDNKFICKACNARKQSTSMVDEPVLCRVSKQIMIHQLPPVLILHMKRFEIGFHEVTKDDRHISFPEMLDMAPYCTSKGLKNMADANGQILYGLYAVVVHQGSSLRHGHYIAYVKTRPTELKEKATTLDEEQCHDMHYDEGYCKKGRWYFTSDTYVRECSLEEVKKSKAYMLFYERLPLTALPETQILD